MISFITILAGQLPFRARASSPSSCNRNKYNMKTCLITQQFSITSVHYIPIFSIPTANMFKSTHFPPFCVFAALGRDANTVLTTEILWTQHNEGNTIKLQTLTLKFVYLFPLDTAIFLVPTCNKNGKLYTSYNIKINKTATWDLIRWL